MGEGSGFMDLEVGFGLGELLGLGRASAGIDFGGMLDVV